MSKPQMVESADDIRALLASLKTFCQYRSDKALAKLRHWRSGDSSLVNAGHFHGEQEAYDTIIQELAGYQVGHARRDKAFRKLVELDEAVHATRRDTDRSIPLGHRNRRDAALAMYCDLTGEDPEAVYESVRDAVIARYEQSLAEREG